LRSGDRVADDLLTTADRILGEPGEDLVEKTIDAIRGTMNGTVSVAITEGLLIGASENRRARRQVLAAGVALHLVILGVFKYLDFLVSSANQLAHLLGLQHEAAALVEVDAADGGVAVAVVHGDAAFEHVGVVAEHDAGGTAGDLHADRLRAGRGLRDRAYRA